MKKKILTLMLAGCILTGCGSGNAASGASSTVQPGTTRESVPGVESTAEEMPSDTSSSDDGTDDLEAIGSVEVDKGLLNVDITIPEEYAKDITDAELQSDVSDKGYKKAVRNDDGSVTLTMTKTQHKEMMSEFRKSLDSSLQNMIGSEDYPNITAIDANDDYTKFTVTTKNTELDLEESFSVMAFYLYGALYNIYNGTPVDNIHVDFRNADSGEIINSADSKDMESATTEAGGEQQ